MKWTRDRHVLKIRRLERNRNSNKGQQAPEFNDELRNERQGLKDYCHQVRLVYRIADSRS